MTSLETIYEIVQRTEKKVTDQNHAMAKIKEWKIRHEEQVIARNEKIDDKLKLLSRTVTVMACMIPFTIYEVREYAGKLVAIFLGI